MCVILPRTIDIKCFMFRIFPKYINRITSKPKRCCRDLAAILVAALLRARANQDPLAAPPNARRSCSKHNRPRSKAWRSREPKNVFPSRSKDQLPLLGHVRTGFHNHYSSWILDGILERRLDYHDKLQFAWLRGVLASTLKGGARSAAGGPDRFQSKPRRSSR